jgi:flagellar export protein FliJ
MQVAPGLARLHAIREAEEKQCRNALDTAAADLSALQRGLAGAKQRRVSARALLTAGVRNNVAEDRLAALDETEALDRIIRVLVERIRDAEERVVQARSRFLAKRVERRQVETLLDAARLEANIEESRKSQSAMDEWFRSRSFNERDRLSRPPCSPAAGTEELDLKPGEV